MLFQYLTAAGCITVHGPVLCQIIKSRMRIHMGFNIGVTAFMPTGLPTGGQINGLAQKWKYVTGLMD